MRIRRVRVSAFGRLEDVDSGEAGLPSLVVVAGPNEAGKSTLFHLLHSLLYGFQPASKEKHPYAPWSGADMDAEAWLELDDGSTWHVHRRLLGSPWGRLSPEGGDPEDIRNRPLFPVDHIPRSLHRQIYALTPDELLGLRKEGWQVVQERLITGFGAHDLRPLSAVATELDKDAGKLWRPDRRGKSEARRLEEELQGLRQRRRAARVTDARVREIVDASGALDLQLSRLRERRHALRAELARLRVLAPLGQRLARIEELRELAGDPAELVGLPNHPQDRLQELDAAAAKLDSERAEDETRARTLEERAGEFTSGHALLLEQGQSIQGLLIRAGAQAQKRAHRRTLDQVIANLERRLEAQSEGLFRVSWSELDREAVRRVDTADLRARMEIYRSARAEAKRRDEEVRWLLKHAERESGGPRSVAWWVRTAAFMLLSLLLAIGVNASWAGATPFLWVAPALVLLWRSVGLAQRRGRRQRLGGEIDAARRSHESSKASALVLGTQTAALVADLPVRPTSLEDPEAGLSRGLERIQETLQFQHAQLEARRQSLEEEEEEEADFSSIDLPSHLVLPEDPVTAAKMLSAELLGAEKIRNSALLARQELDTLHRRRRGRETEAKSVGAELAELHSRLELLGDGDRAKGIGRAEERIRARETMARLREEIEVSTPDLPAREADILAAEQSGERWTTDPQEVDRLGREEQELSAELERMSAGAAALGRELEHLTETESLDRIDGDIETSELQLADVRFQRDRLLLLASLLRTAEERFREEHQPDVIERAGRHLSAITGGRYERLQPEDEGVFHLVGPDIPGAVPVGEPISRGTREQVYLALRLALLDHLDQGHERLPLFLDEAFVNWDPTRRERAFSLIEGMARDRQIIIFTCHPELVVELEGRGAAVIHLGPGEPSGAAPIEVPGPPASPAEEVGAPPQQTLALE